MFAFLTFLEHRRLYEHLHWTRHCQQRRLHNYRVRGLRLQETRLESFLSPGFSVACPWSPRRRASEGLGEWQRRFVWVGMCTAPLSPLAFPVPFGKIRVWEPSLPFNWNENSVWHDVASRMWASGSELLVLTLSGLRTWSDPHFTASFSLCTEWNNNHLSSRDCLWVLSERLGKVSLWSLVLRVLMKNLKRDPRTSSSFPFPTTQYLPSPVWPAKPPSARVVVVKNVLSLPLAFPVACHHADWWSVLSRSSL